MYSCKISESGVENTENHSKVESTSSTDENIEIDRNVHRAGQHRKWIGNQTIVSIRSVEFIAYFARYDDRWSPDR